MSEEPEDVCYLCIRIPASEVLKVAHKIWENREVARRMGLEATATIRMVYQKNPTYFCGRQKSSILGGLLYYLGIVRKERASQNDIAKVLGVNRATVRNSSKLWYRLFYGSEDNFYREYLPAVQRQRETKKNGRKPNYGYKPAGRGKK